MPYELSVPAGADYLLVKWHGWVSAAESKACNTEALEFASEHDLKRVLVDLREVQNRQSTLDLYSRTVEHAEVGPQHPRVALLGRADQEGDLRFVESVAYNRGIPMMSFTSLGDALTWLES